MKITELFESKQGAKPAIYVVGKLDIGYVNHDDREKMVTVIVFQDMKTPEAAEALVQKFKKIDDDKGVIEINQDKHDDELYHMAQNGGKGDISSVHGDAYLHSVKVVPAEPKVAKKVFSFDLSNAGTN